MGKQISLTPKRILQVSLAFLMLFGSFFGLIQLIRPAVTQKSAKTLPQYGWVVCEDLEVGDVPGTDPAQRFRLCHPDGHKLLAYCLDQNVAPPPVGCHCELLNNETFWCGDDYQRLKPYAILQTPPPPPTRAATVAFTRTPSPAYTATHLPTGNPRFDKTPPPEEFRTPPSEPSANGAPTPTPTQRPRMGGDSNLGFSKLIQWSFGLILLVFAFMLVRKDWKRHRGNGNA